MPFSLSHQLHPVYRRRSLKKIWASALFLTQHISWRGACRVLSCLGCLHSASAPSFPIWIYSAGQRKERQQATSTHLSERLVYFRSELCPDSSSSQAHHSFWDFWIVFKGTAYQFTILPFGLSLPLYTCTCSAEPLCSHWYGQHSGGGIHK